MKLTLPIDSAERKDVPMVGGLLRYCPAALAAVARHSKAGNDKHNPGEPLHHARDKSTDHEECIFRHLTDMQDIRAALEREGQNPITVKALLDEANAMCWRTLMLSQELQERYAGAPLAPGARLSSVKPIGTLDLTKAAAALDRLSPYDALYCW